jgi:hypothetical protein
LPFSARSQSDRQCLLVRMLAKLRRNVFLDLRFFPLNKLKIGRICR